MIEIPKVIIKPSNPADPEQNKYCPPAQLPRARLQINDPGISFVHVTKVGGFAKPDVPLNFPFPCNWIMVSACDNSHLADTLFLHFKPLNKQYNGTAIIPVGNEEWLPLVLIVGGASRKIGSGYRFNFPMPMNCFLDIGQEAGGGTDYQLTFAVGNDVAYWNLF
jgi:hypothetical protein